MEDGQQHLILSLTLSQVGSGPIEKERDPKEVHVSIPHFLPEPLNCALSHPPTINSSKSPMNKVGLGFEKPGPQSGKEPGVPFHLSLEAIPGLA